MNTENTNWVYVDPKTTANSIEFDNATTLPYKLPESSAEARKFSEIVVYTDESGNLTASSGIAFPRDADGIMCKPGDILSRVYQSQDEASNASLSMYKCLGIGMGNQIILQGFSYPYSEVNNSPLFTAESSQYVHALNSDCDTIAQTVVREAVQLLSKQRSNSNTLPSENREVVDQISKLLKFYMHLYYGIQFDSEMIAAIDSVEDGQIEE